MPSFPTCSLRVSAARSRRKLPGMKYDLKTFRGDLFGALTSAVIALPVALAFGIASGLGPAAGMYGAIAVGFFAAVFGGTPFQVSGPTAPMAVAMAVIITNYAASLPEALTVVVLGGLLQMSLGLLRAGRFVAYTPHVVISGFMSGIGIIVMLIQVLPFVGAPSVSGGAMGAIRALPEALGNINFHALAIALVTLAVGVFWPAAPSCEGDAWAAGRFAGRHLTGCAVAERSSDHRRGAGRSAERASGPSFG